MVFDVFDILTALPSFDGPSRRAGQRRNLLAKWTFGLALAGIITGGLTSLIAPITGVIALVQISGTRECGAGMAVKGIILGFLITVLWAIVIGAVIVDMLSR